MLPAPPLIRIAFYLAASGGTATWEDRSVPGCIDISWDELCEELSRHEFTPCGVTCVGHDCRYKMSAEAWSPADLIGRRSNKNVRAITLAVFDLDDISHEEMLGIAQRIEGFEYLCVSSHSHRPPNAYRMRLIMPLTRPATPAEWPVVLRTAISGLQLPADPSCKDLARLYFLPTAPVGTQPIAERGHGIALDVDWLLRAATEVVPSHTAPQWPAEPIDESLDNLPGLASSDLAELRKRLAQVRNRKAHSSDVTDKQHYAMLSAIIKGQPFAVPGNYQGATTLYRGRDNAINQAMSLIGFALPPQTSTGAAIELIKMSLYQMQVEPEGLNYWIGRAAFSYERAMMRRLERDAKADAANARIRERFAVMRSPLSAPQSMQYALHGTQSASHVSQPWTPQIPPWQADKNTRLDPQSPIFQPPLPPAPQFRPVQGENITSGDWRDALVFDKGKLKNCGENIRVILENTPEIAKQLRWNEVTKDIEITGGPFKDVQAEVLDVVLADCLQREFNLTVEVTAVGQRIEAVARAHSYDPLANYLNGLRWNCTSLIDNFFITHLGAKTTDAQGRDITKHLQRISRRWFVSAVARGLVPGCKVDTILVLEGAQGAKKTTTFETLGGAWYSGSQVVIGNKDSQMLVASCWIIELADFASYRRTERTAMNAFVTDRFDIFRAPYGRRISKTPRRAILVGTVNPEAGVGYLTDPTGNRRYWPVAVGDIDLDRIKQDRDQLFAEAVCAFKAGEKWHLEQHEAAVAEEVAEERLVESSIPAKIAEWWFAMSPAQRPTEIQTHSVAEQALRCDPDRITRAIQTEIGHAFATFRNPDGSPAFTKHRRPHNGRLAWIYVPTQQIKDALQQRGHLRIVGPALGPHTFGRRPDQPIKPWPSA